MLSTWSSNLPFGNARISVMNSAIPGAFLGKKTHPASIITEVWSTR